MWSCKRNRRVLKISTAQKMLDSTLQAAKNATAPTAAKPVKAVHSTIPDTPIRSRISSSAAAAIRLADSRRRTTAISSGRPRPSTSRRTSNRTSRCSSQAASTISSTWPIGMIVSSQPCTQSGNRSFICLHSCGRRAAWWSF